MTCYSLLAVLTALAVPASLPPQRLLPDDLSRQLATEASTLLNTERRDAGLAPLIHDPDLALVAFQHSVEMAERGQVTHYSKWYGLDTRRRIRMAYPEIGMLAENVARNRSTAELHLSLMRSPGHRRNRLEERFTHVGIGVVRKTSYQMYLTEIFVRYDRGPQLGPPTALYTDFDPATIDRVDAPRAELNSEAFTVGPPDHDNPEYWTYIGIDNFHRGETHEAIVAFETALAIDPTYSYARFDLGRAYLQAGRASEAYAILRIYLDTKPDDVEAWRSYGAALLLLEEFKAAERAFRRVLEEREREAHTWYNLGLALEYQSRQTEAMLAYVQALDLEPGLEQARSGLERIQR